MQFFEKSETPKNEVSVIETETADAKEVIDVTIFDDLDVMRKFIEDGVLPHYREKYGDQFTFTVINESGLIDTPDAFNKAKEYLINSEKKDKEALAQGKTLRKKMFIFDNSFGLGKETEGCHLAKLARDLYPQNSSDNILLIGHTNDAPTEEGYIMLSQNVDKMFIKLSSRFAEKVLKEKKIKPNSLRTSSKSNVDDLESIISLKWRKTSVTDALADNLMKVTLSG